MIRLTSFLILVLILCAAGPFASAQSSEEPCSSRETVYPLVKTAILDEATYRGIRVRYAAPGERLDIIGSKRFGPWCWLQVSDGWLIDSASALRSEPPATASQSVRAGDRACYRADKAYVVGKMNIRAGASTTSGVLASAWPGDVYPVALSRQGATWCWLRIDAGWMANTSRVRFTKPAQSVAAGATSPAASQPANIDNCCFVDRQCAGEQEWSDGYWAFQTGQCRADARPAASKHDGDPWASSARTRNRPIIEGSQWFVYGISSTLDLMQRSAPEWYNFVLNAADRIVESFNEPTPTYPHANTTNWGNGATRTIGVGAGSLACYVGRLCRVSVAGILAHEAAHIHEHYLVALIYPQFAATDPHDSPRLSATNAIASIRAGYSRSVK